MPSISSWTTFTSTSLYDVTLHIPADKYTEVENDEYGKRFEHIVDITDGSSLTPKFALTDAESTIPVSTGQDYRAGDFTYSRTVSGKYGSFCFPFDVKLSSFDGIESAYVPISEAIYNAASNRVTLFLEKVTDDIILAGTPFLARFNDGATSLLFTNHTRFSFPNEITANPTGTAITTFSQEENSGLVIRDNSIGLKWCGTYIPTDITGMKSFNSDGTFGNHTGTINPYRAYISQTAVAGAKSATIWVDFGDCVTSIGEIVNGELKITDGAIYNINGQRLSAPREGQINIIGGKKIYVK